MKFTCFIISVAVLTLAKGQVQEGTPCETPNEEYGTCINLNNCEELLNMLLTKSSDPTIKTYLRSSVCGYSGKDPLVCCPQQKVKNITPSPTSPAEVISEKLPVKPNCGFSNVTNQRIVNGIPVKLGELPWLVALGYKNNQNPDAPKWLCGGTLITSRHILTAAHCVHNRQDLYLARVGDLDLFADDDGASPETIPLIKAKVHEEYSPVQFSSDIAILTLARAPTTHTVWPVCLPLEDPLRTRSLVKLRPLVAGWGSISFNGPTSAWLQEVIIPIVDNQQCERAYGSRALIDNRIICAGYARGGKDACQGDSGGPLMLGTNERTNLRYYQVGVVSYGLKCAEAGYPGVYTRITSFLDWIQKNLN